MHVDPYSARRDASVLIEPPDTDLDSSHIFPHIAFQIPMPAFQNPTLYGINKRKPDEHDLNPVGRKRQAVEDESGSSGVSAMEGDQYWMVQW